MYFDTSSVSTLKPSKQYFVSIINGTKDNVIGKHSISLDKLNFDYVLIFLFLNFNQIIITQITLSLNCIVIFWFDYCVFKDIKTKKTIGCHTSNI